MFRLRLARVGASERSKRAGPLWPEVNAAWGQCASLLSALYDHFEIEPHEAYVLEPHGAASCIINRTSKIKLPLFYASKFFSSKGSKDFARGCRNYVRMMGHLCCVLDERRVDVGRELTEDHMKEMRSQAG